MVVNQILNTRLRLAELERRAETGHITPEEMRALTAQVVEVVRHHIPEPERFRAFSEEIGRLLDEAAV